MSAVDRLRLELARLLATLAFLPALFARILAVALLLLVAGCGPEEEHEPSVPECEYRDGGYGPRDSSACLPRAYLCVLEDGGKGVCQ